MDTSLFCSFSAIAQWPAFPQETRTWAGDQYRRVGIYYRLGPDSNANRMMREWWDHNREAVLTRRYQDATWLPPASEQVADGLLAKNLSSEPAPTNPAPVVPPPAPVALATTDTSIPFWFYGIIILSLGAIGGLGYFLKSRR